MTRPLPHRRPATAAALVAAAAVLAVLGADRVQAQDAGERMRREYESLGALLDAAALADVRVFEALIDIGTAPALSNAREQLAATLEMRAHMSMAAMMAMMRMQSDMQMLGPFNDLETPASLEILELFESSVSRREIRNAYQASTLPARAVEMLRRGHELEGRVFDILATDSIGDKSAALGAAAGAYLAEALTVPGEPKPAALLLEHLHGGAFVEAYPKLSRIVRSAQWLRLAAIEAMIFEEQGAGDWGSVAEVEARFRSKLSPAEHGHGASPVPIELPMAPTIAPTLYSLSPQTAIILDNLSMFRAIVADLLAYPNLDDTSTRIEALVDEFTDHAGSFDAPIDYLVSALRGGIYNQGGPAIGELQASERNRSRMEMGMQHAMIMSSP